MTWSPTHSSWVDLSCRCGPCTPRVEGPPMQQFPHPRDVGNSKGWRVLTALTTPLWGCREAPRVAQLLQGKFPHPGGAGNPWDWRIVAILQPRGFYTFPRWGDHPCSDHAALGVSPHPRVGRPLQLGSTRPLGLFAHQSPRFMAAMIPRVQGVSHVYENPGPWGSQLLWSLGHRGFHWAWSFLLCNTYFAHVAGVQVFVQLLS